MVRHSRRPTALSSPILGAVFLWSALAAGSASAVDLAGAWSGSWASTSTGHAGPLRATFTPCGPGRYSVEFRGRFCRILPFRYTVVLTVVEDGGDSVTLAGTSFLGRLFGTFTYRATADDCRFEACYTSRRDQGSFRLSRAGG
jgi:hypothetical protein